VAALGEAPRTAATSPYTAAFYRNEAVPAMPPALPLPLPLLLALALPLPLPLPLQSPLPLPLTLTLPRPSPPRRLRGAATSPAARTRSCR